MMHRSAIFVVRLPSATETAINVLTAETQWDARRFKNEILNVFRSLKSKYEPV